MVRRGAPAFPAFPAVGFERPVEPAVRRQRPYHTLDGRVVDHRGVRAHVVRHRGTQRRILFHCELHRPHHQIAYGQRKEAESQMEGIPMLRTSVVHRPAGHVEHVPRLHEDIPRDLAGHVADIVVVHDRLRRQGPCPGVIPIEPPALGARALAHQNVMRVEVDMEAGVRLRRQVEIGPDVHGERGRQRIREARHPGQIFVHADDSDRCPFQESLVEVLDLREVGASEQAAVVLDCSPIDDQLDVRRQNPDMRKHIVDVGHRRHVGDGESACRLVRPVDGFFVDVRQKRSKRHAEEVRDERIFRIRVVGVRDLGTPVRRCGSLPTFGRSGGLAVFQRLLPHIHSRALYIRSCCR